MEWSSPGITVNTIRVGPVYSSAWADDGSGDTPIERQYENVPTEIDEDAATLVGRVGRPSDVAALVVFLVSPEAGFITGESITCDGGRLISRLPEPIEQEVGSKK